MTVPDRQVIRDAATVLVLDRDSSGQPSVLMGQRGASAAFMPSKYVFPGGAVDAEDAQVALARPLSPVTETRLRAEPRTPSTVSPQILAAAALRELAEETGLLSGVPGPAPTGWGQYQRAGLAPDASGLIYLFRAITPPGRTRRFDARFLVLDAGQLHGDRHDFRDACDELSHLHWVPLDQARRLDLPFITEVVLAELANLVQLSGGGPLIDPPSVPFFDNRGDEPRFLRLGLDG
ncbi:MULTISPECIES: NUDIX domain-containing protein [unclassified Paracoccus (in: a-proteobacteria)]|uniref:NUDIX domain-containing protein n=1 Tax=unclassified Paracoccus (in: a-proteobacteria) TaxID=2688777 RepID=UPI0012B1F003|nr:MULTISPECIES: NUDIX domain-containing protein [unclassified Paracoccus (in: a-proteobacteria)]UXU74763.1 NUDIX domain-containing protein [Paracoccus sp. SMMA_5]UXU80660.1 NUDIX domain-containing protein [Paracoccus sp. SMMA_5_TC]